MELACWIKLSGLLKRKGRRAKVRGTTNSPTRYQWIYMPRPTRGGRILEMAIEQRGGTRRCGPIVPPPCRPATFVPRRITTLTLRLRVMPEQTDDISKCHGLDEFSPDTARFRVLLGTQVADNRPLGQGNRCAPACFNNGNYRGYSPPSF